MSKANVKPRERRPRPEQQGTSEIRRMLIGRELFNETK
jgi:hypothetical protein